MQCLLDVAIGIRSVASDYVAGTIASPLRTGKIKFQHFNSIVQRLSPMV
jgi:hypothetical protein